MAREPRHRAVGRPSYYLRTDRALVAVPPSPPEAISDPCSNADRATLLQAATDSVSMNQCDALVELLKHRLEEEKPRDPLRFLRALLDSRIEQRQAKSLSTEISSAMSTPQFQVERRSQRSNTLFGMDVGGSLSKITFFEPKGSGGIEAEFINRSDRYGSTGVRDARLSFDWRGGTFHFLNFETRRMGGAITMMQEHHLLKKDEVLFATGGGSHKFCEEITKRLGLSVIKGDELQCLLWGINFLLQHVRNECYYLENPKSPLTSQTISYEGSYGSVFPYLLVNIGSGVSILKVDSNDSFQRVSGTIMGGGTFWGLCRMLTKCQTFEEALQLATVGDAKKVNMLVGDIYGGDYEMFGLSADTVASAFGKLGFEDAKRAGASDADIARGLLEMIGQNIAQLAYLCARRYNLTRILFCGNFLRNNRLSMGSISYAIDYWSHGVQKALFMLHEGYFGAMGAFFLPDEQPWQPDDDLSPTGSDPVPPQDPCENVLVDADVLHVDCNQMDNSTDDFVQCSLRTPPPISPFYQTK